MKAALVLALAAATQGTSYVNVTASYVAPARRGADAVITVQLSPVDGSIRVNEDPAPRLKLEKDQELLAAKPQPRPSPRPPGGEPRYLDPLVPVAFPVTLSDRAPRGLHTVKGTVTYFYCSKTEGWCRKGTADIEVPVRVP